MRADFKMKSDDENLPEDKCSPIDNSCAALPDSIASLLLPAGGHLEAFPSSGREEEGAQADQKDQADDLEDSLEVKSLGSSHLIQRGQWKKSLGAMVSISS